MSTNTLVIVVLILLLVGGPFYAQRTWGPGWWSWGGVLTFVLFLVLLRALGVLNFSLSI